MPREWMSRRWSRLVLSPADAQRPALDRLGALGEPLPGRASELFDQLCSDWPSAAGQRYSQFRARSSELDRPGRAPFIAILALGGLDRAPDREAMPLMRQCIADATDVLRQLVGPCPGLSRRILRPTIAGLTEMLQSFLRSEIVRHRQRLVFEHARTAP